MKYVYLIWNHDGVHGILMHAASSLKKAFAAVAKQYDVDQDSWREEHKKIGDHNPTGVGGERIEIHRKIDGHKLNKTYDIVWLPVDGDYVPF